MKPSLTDLAFVDSNTLKGPPYGKQSDGDCTECEALTPVPDPKNGFNGNEVQN